MRYQVNNFSKFWLDDNDTGAVDTFLGLDEPKTKGRDLVALAGYRRAISNYVSIVTGKSIPVKFKTRHSYTDGKTVTLGASLNDGNLDTDRKSVV